MNDPYREASPPTPPEGDPAARAEIAPALAPGETLLWAGQPKQGIRFSTIDLFLIPFFCVWGGGAIFWESLVIYAAVTNGVATLPFAAFGLPFVAIGLYMLVGRFLYDRAKRARTFYGVTDQRALIVHAGRKKRNETSVDLACQEVITLSEGRDGRGTIHFGRGTPDLGPSGLPARGATPMFFRIERARAVHDRIREAARARREPPANGRIRVAEAEEAFGDDEAERAARQGRIS